MARKVYVRAPNHEVGKEQVGVQFKITSDGQGMARLVVSKGGLLYKAPNDEKYHVISWEKFADFAEGFPKKHLATDGDW